MIDAALVGRNDIHLHKGGILEASMRRHETIHWLAIDCLPNSTSQTYTETTIFCKDLEQLRPLYDALREVFEGGEA